jgi:hypothetical protein
MCAAHRDGSRRPMVGGAGAAVTVEAMSLIPVGLREQNVTIRAFRLYLQYEDKAISRAMSLTHFGVADWVSSRLKDIPH